MEDIKLLVQEEGRSARNLVAFNVPVIETQCDSSKIMRKPPTSPRSQLEIKKDEHSRSTKRSRESSQSGSRVRSASTGRDKKSELHARYWAFLFGNLQRAVDEIYQTCESDESVTECKEVIMVLDNYTREFKNLINWFKIKWEYETTPPPQRPRSLAWEIRKSSPGKIRHKSVESNASNNNFINSPLSLFFNSKSIFQTSCDENQHKMVENNMVKSLPKMVTLDEIEGNKSVDSNEVSNVNNLVNGEREEITQGTDLCNGKEDADKSTPVSRIKPEEKQESVVVETTMVDEICQTDAEKDVDENGPKFISSSQQTCSLITGFDTSNEKEASKKSDSNTSTDSGISKSIKTKASEPELIPKGETKVLSKSTSLSFTAKTSTPSTVPSSNSAAAKGTVRSSYSLATTNATRVLNSTQNSARTGTFGKSPRMAVSDKKSNPVPVRQPWGARPLSSLSARVTSASNFPAGAKLTRSRTIAEVRNSKPLGVKTTKTVSTSKQEQQTKGTATSKSSCSAFCSQLKALAGIRTKIISVIATVSEPVENGKSKSSKGFNESIQTESSKEINSNSNTSLSSSTSSSVKQQETCTSVEVLTSQGCGTEEDDGWVKVRSRSRFSPATKANDIETSLSRSASNLKPKSEQKGNLIKMSHKTRFYQPSSAISLPTLAFSESDCKENIATKKLTKNKTDPKNKLKENVKTVKKVEKTKVEEGNNKKNCLEKAKKNSTRLLNEKNLNATVKETKHKKMEEAENEKNKKEGGGGKETKKSIIPDDEEENNFDEEIKKNKETEEMLQKEINELEATDIEIDIETGDEETDGETTTGTEEELDHEKKCTDSVAAEKKPSPKKQHRYEQIFSGMSWADHMDTLDELEKLVVQDCSSKGMTKDEQMDTLERLEEFVARHPGRALELHQKLSSPSRRRTMLDTVKRFQARQAKAYEKREQLKMEKAQKLRELLKKVDEVKAAKDKLIEDRRQRLEMKLKRAAENRNLHLKEIMRKAHDEEEKLKEIAFINELEAQNKRHDFMTQCQEQEGRLQGIHEERQRKQEEKAAKEAAVEERRKAIEAERQEKLEKMQERQRKRDEQADKKKQEKEKERQELAREKARDRSERLEALHAAQLEAQEELQKKIQQKQEDYARRHEENIEQIRQKALELSILKCSEDAPPRLAPYETQKLCTACNVLIGSEVYLLSHLRGKKHQEAVKSQMNGKDCTKEEIERHNIKIIVNAPSDKIDPKIALDKERIKSFKKKCKKIRLRMVSKGEEYLSKLDKTEKMDSPGKGKLQKCLKDIEKANSSQGKGQWSDSAITILERSMGEICRTLNKQDRQDQLVFRCLNGFCTLNNILQLDMEVPPNMTPYLPQKCFVTASSTYLAAVDNSPDNCKFLILSNKIISLLDLLLKRLTELIPDQVSGSVVYHSKSSLPIDPVASVVMRVIAKILTYGKENETNGSDDYLQRLQDIISYTVSSGIVDKLTRYCKSVRDPIDDHHSATQFLLSILELLTTLTACCRTVRQGSEDPTQLLATLQVTELVGAVSILYGMLLHQGTPPRLIDATPPTLPSHTIAVSVGTIRFLRSVAELDLQMFQSILGAEGISLQFRHIASYLLWSCCQDKDKILLHEVVAVVGFFAVQHRDNQMILQSGSTPTVLQQLCNLPFPYFSDPELSALLFPTLLACCSDNEENKAILEQEISYSLLEDFMESEAAKNHRLIQLISLQTKGAKS